MQENTSDLLQLFVMFAASVFDTSIAEVIGPYLLIVFAAATGACWALGRRESKGGWASLFYFVRIVFTAVLLTSVIVQLLTHYVEQYVNVVDAGLLLAPVALLIGFIGDDWLKVFSWGMELIKKIANKFINQKLGE